ncbi:MAG: hypothetical protein LBR89_01670, partial [Holosporales bacterium]|nr:hypothetical protein [Holosporales bacterium]
MYCSASEEEAQVGQDSSPPPPPPPPPPPAAEGALWTPFYMPTGMAELMYRQVYERAPFNRARKAFFTYCGAGSDRDPSPTGFFNAIVLACNEFPRCVNEHMHPLMVELAALQANLSNTDNELRAVRDADTDSFLYDYLGWVRHTEDMNARETFLCEQLMSIHKDIHECEEKIKAHQALLALPTDHLISKLTHDLRNSDGHLLASWSEVESHARAAASKARLGSVATVKQVEYESQFKFVHSALPGFLISLLSAHADEGGWIVLNSDGNDSVSRMMTALNELFNIWRKKELLELLIKYHPIRSTKSSVYRSQKISAIPLWIELNELISVTLAGPARLNIVPVLSVHEGACVVEVPEAITLIRNAFMANAARLEEEFGGRFRAWDVAYVLFYGNEDERMELLRREDVRNYLNVLLNKKLNIIDCFYG